MKKLFTVNILSKGPVTGVRGLIGPKDRVKLTETAVNALKASGCKFDIVGEQSMTTRQIGLVGSVFNAEPGLTRRGVVRSENGITRRGVVKSETSVKRRGGEVAQETVTKREVARKIEATINKAPEPEEIKFDITPDEAANDIQIDNDDIDLDNIMDKLDNNVVEDELVNTDIVEEDTDEVVDDINKDILGEDNSEPEEEIIEDTTEESTEDIELLKETLKLYNPEMDESIEDIDSIKSDLVFYESKFREHLLKFSPAGTSISLNSEELLAYKKMTVSEVNKMNGAKCTSFLNDLNAEVKPRELVRDKKAKILYLLELGEYPEGS